MSGSGTPHFGGSGVYVDPALSRHAPMAGSYSSSFPAAAGSDGRAVAAATGVGAGRGGRGDYLLPYDDNPHDDRDGVLRLGAAAATALSASESSFTSSSWRDVAVLAAKRFGAKYVIDGVFADETLSRSRTSRRGRGQLPSAPAVEVDHALREWCKVLGGRSSSSSSPAAAAAAQGPLQQTDAVSGSPAAETDQSLVEEEDEEETNRIAHLLSKSPGIGVPLPPAVEPINPTTQRRLVYFSAEDPPVPVIAEPHRRFIGVSFYKIKKVSSAAAACRRGGAPERPWGNKSPFPPHQGESQSTGTSPILGGGGQAPSSSSIMLSQSVSMSSPNSYEDFVYRFSPFFFGTVLGYSDDNESIIWQERTQRFATRFRLQDVRYLIRAQVMRCRHCGQVQLVSELSKHLSTHVQHVLPEGADDEQEEEETAAAAAAVAATAVVNKAGMPHPTAITATTVAASDLETPRTSTAPFSSPDGGPDKQAAGVEDGAALLFCGQPEFGQACGDVALLQRMRTVRPLGEGAQGVVTLCQVPLKRHHSDAPPRTDDRAHQHENQGVAQRSAAEPEKETTRAETPEQLEDRENQSVASSERKSCESEKMDNPISPSDPPGAALPSPSLLPPTSAPLCSTQEKLEGVEEDAAVMNVVVKTCSFDSFAEAQEHYRKSVHFMSCLTEATQHHLIQYYAVQCLPDTPTVRVVMPYYAEGDVSQFIAESDGVPVEEPMLVRMGLQMCTALRYLHERNPPIVHGDITPSNVMFRDNRTALVLMDLDASTEWTGGGGAGAGQRASLTTTTRRRRRGADGADDAAAGLGTTAYMAPETMESGCRMPPSDMWSLGVLLFIAAVMPDFPTLKDPRTGEEVLLNVASCWATEREEARLSLFQRYSTMNRRAMVRESVTEGERLGNGGGGGLNEPEAASDGMSVHRSCVRSAIVARGYSEAFAHVVTSLLNFDPFQRPSAAQLQGALQRLLQG